MGKAIRTNGIGQTTTAHLNLTRSLADIPHTEPKPRKARKIGRPKGPNLIRPRFAGDTKFEESAA